MKKIILFMTLWTIGLYAMTDIELAKKSDAMTDGFQSSSSNMTMTLINSAKQKTIRQMSSKTLEGVNGDKSLMVFLTPADVKGTKMLTYEHINKDDDQWMYLPALKRIKRIASRNKSGSFMGSEFSYEDTANNSWEKYTYGGVLEEVVFNGTKHYKSTRIPKDKNSGYSKQITYIDATTFLVSKIDYYDRKKELLKTSIFSEWLNINGIYLMGKIVMTNHQNRKQTILQWSDQKIQIQLSKKDFSKRKLKR
jgi:hypothetical protein